MSVVNVIQPQSLPPLTCFDIAGKVGVVALQQDRHIILITEDQTRPNTQVCKALLSHLVERHGRNNITLVVGNGLHRPPSRGELVEKFGEDVKWIRTFFNNPMCNREWLSELKKSDGAYVIALSSTVPHMHVQMSGGDKVVIPGCGHWSTIEHFHSTNRLTARRMMREMGNKIIDYYVCSAIDWRNLCVDIYCGESCYELDEFIHRAMDYFKVSIPEELPDAVILEPTIKTFDFEQCMNVFNIIRSGGTKKQIVKRGGVMAVKANPQDGMGVHYMFQAINGISPVYFDDVFAAELEDRHIVIISNNLAGESSVINHYMSPETMIGE